MKLHAVTQLRLSDQVYAQLKRRILLGEFGAPLTETDLAAQLEVSRTPLREALGALAAEGWVNRLPGGGVNAAEISLREIRDAISARADLEARAAEYASLRASTDDLGHLQQTLLESDRSLHNGALEEAASWNKQFHRAIAEATGSRVLVRLFETVYDYSIAGGTFSAYSRYPDVQAKVERLKQVSVTHGEILRAIVERDPVLAAHRMRTHIEEVMTAYRLGDVAGVEPA